MSFYVQITKRCNMTCNHCAFSCGAQGPDMSAQTFRRVLDLAAQEQAPFAIGGGEPTLHATFMEVDSDKRLIDISLQ
ncbi:MAG: radical SAM protein [Limisphaerales bacterium]